MKEEKIYLSVLRLIILTIVGICIQVKCDDDAPIPADENKVRTWFEQNIKSTQFNQVLQNAEKSRKVIKVGPNGDFKTVSEAVASVPTGNTGRVIIHIAKGVYNEKIKVERTKPFITFYGETGATLQYGGTAKQYGTYDSASVIVEADYFIAYNIIFKNTAPRPTFEDCKSNSSAAAQALALRIGGDMAAFYVCKFYGYQDTLCDEKGRHLFMNCYIEGTVDFIFGNGKSLYLQSRIHVLKEAWNTVIVAQAKQEPFEDSGFSFVHCIITGDDFQEVNLGRAWKKMAKVVYSYCTMDNSIHPVAWDAKEHSSQHIHFGEYQNKGPGANMQGRASFLKKLDDAGAKYFLNFGFIQASRWLLPPVPA
ncbi:Pectin lyase-like superfamily protein [Euphorbia peplus]|nr:Pectin lyase-like superfamily protein [Euphorbia peplus]